MTRPAVVSALLVGAAVLVVGGVLRLGASGDPPGRPSGGTSAATAAPSAAVQVGTSPGRSAARVPGAGVLHAWDRRRARAYADGDPVALSRLYVRGSVAGERDVRTLRRYDRRGLRVVGMRMQLLALDALAHRPGLWRLRVTDRLQRATAVGHGAHVALPHDAASTRVVTLVHTTAGWRVRSVVAQPPGAG